MKNVGSCLSPWLTRTQLGGKGGASFHTLWPCTAACKGSAVAIFPTSDLWTATDCMHVISTLILAICNRLTSFQDKHVSGMTGSIFLSLEIPGSTLLHGRVGQIKMPWKNVIFAHYGGGMFLDSNIPQTHSYQRMNNTVLTWWWIKIRASRTTDR